MTSLPSLPSLPSLTSLLRVENFGIEVKSKWLFEPVSFEVNRGITCLVGPSGVGKSTLLHGLVGLLEENSNFEAKGNVTLAGVLHNEIPLREFRRRVALLPQVPVMFYGSIEKNVLIGARAHNLTNTRTEKAFLEELLRSVNLWSELKNRLHEPAQRLSTGQKQRLALARVLAIGSEVLLLDEPTAALDPCNVLRFEELVRSVACEKGIVMVTHNMEQVRRLAGRIVTLRSVVSETQTLLQPESRMRAAALTMQKEF